METHRRVMAMRQTTLRAESVTLVKESEANNCIVRTDDGITCSAVHNSFNGLYYADDKYGIINLKTT